MLSLSFLVIKVMKKEKMGLTHFCRCLAGAGRPSCLVFSTRRRISGSGDKKKSCKKQFMNQKSF